MNSYAFFTDSDSDLPFRFVDELELDMVYMPYMVDGKEYFDDLGRNGKEKEFFDAMRGGAAPVTSLLPTAAYEEYFEPVLDGIFCSRRFPVSCPAPFRISTPPGRSFCSATPNAA